MYSVGYRDMSDEIFAIVQFRLSEECCRDLCRPIMQDEVRRALFSMKNEKARVRMASLLTSSNLPRRWLVRIFVMF